MTAYYKNDIYYERSCFFCSCCCPKKYGYTKEQMMKEYLRNNTMSDILADNDDTASIAAMRVVSESSNPCPAELLI